MFGSKRDKVRRLQKVVELICEQTQRGGIRPASLARLLGVNRATIHKDLAVLHEQGVRLAEDEQGRLILPDE